MISEGIGVIGLNLNNIDSNIMRISNFYLPLNRRFSGDFRGNRGSLILLNLLNIRSEICR